MHERFAVRVFYFLQVGRIDPAFVAHSMSSVECEIQSSCYICNEIVGFLEPDRQAQMTVFSKLIRPTLGTASCRCANMYDQALIVPQ
ncbi:hypothetical protein D3C80_539590 [compost metagenome]